MKKKIGIQNNHCLIFNSYLQIFVYFVLKYLDDAIYKEQSTWWPQLDRRSML